MQNKKLHIISFDNPYPPVYGGVIDVFFKVKALHQLGYEIYLHCFVSKIPENFSELNSIVEKVYFYKSSKNPFLFFSKIPFSVISRNNTKLSENVEKIHAPILFESLKTTYLVNNNKLNGYFKILRLHNIEQDYFRGVSRSESSFFRKILFYFESKKYHTYESVVNKFDQVITLSHFENEYINSKFKNSVYIPVFHGNTNVLPIEGIGEYALYHGDLNTADNREVARFLIASFKKIPDYKLIIASGSNEKWVSNLIGTSKTIEFVRLKNFSHLQDLLKEAHINISWSFQKSGTKLKLINSLFNSRFSIINENIIDDDKVANLCIQVNNESQLIKKIIELKNMPFVDFKKRKEVLERHLNDKINAELIDKLIP